MYRIILTLTLLLSITVAQAQFVPQGLSYQCVVRDANQQPVLNQVVNLIFSIRSGAANGPIVFSERHSVNTSANGLVSLVVGKGQVLSGQFTGVNWSGGSKYFQVFLDQSGNVIDLGTTEFQAVPYAMHALTAANSTGGDNWGNQTVTTTGTLSGNGTNANPLTLAGQNANTGQVLKWNGTTWIPQDDIAATGVNGGTITSIQTGTGLTGGPITTSGSIGLAPTGVVPGAYGSASEIPVLTIDATGRITNIWTSVSSPGTMNVVGGTGIAVQQNGLGFTVTNTGDTNAADDLTTTTTFNGDVIGTAQNLQIKPNVVTTNEILNQTVQGADINPMDAAVGQVLKWNGNVWKPENDETGTNTGQLNLNAGAGIMLTGTTPNLTVVNSGDVNASDDLLDTDVAGGDVSGVFSNLQIRANAVSTTEVANSAITAVKLDDMGATNGQILKWNGTTWAPAADATGVPAATYAAGAGVAITGTAPTLTIANTGDINAADDLRITDIADGDVSGIFSNLLINTEAVTTPKLANSAVTAAKLANMGATTGQILKWNGTTWAPAADAGGTAYLAGSGITINGTGANQSIVNVGDLSNTNEIQTLSLTGNTLLLSNGGGSVTLPATGGTSYTNGTGLSITGTAPNLTINNTGDLSSTNELQALSLVGNTLSLSNGGGTVTLPAGSGNNYANGPGLSITGTAPNLTINNTGDLSSTNELQALSLVGNTLSLSNGGGTVTLPAGSGNNYTQGAGITISGTAPNLSITNSGDLSATNELQNLSLNGTVLSLTGSTTTVDLSGLSGTAGLWAASGAADQRNTNTGNVLIGAASNPIGSAKLQVASARPDVAAITTIGSIGVNTIAPSATLHVQGTDSTALLAANTPTLWFVNDVTGSPSPKARSGFVQLNSRALMVGTPNDSTNIQLEAGGKNALMVNAKTGNTGVGGDNNEPYQLKVFARQQGLNIENAATGQDWEFWVNDQGQLVLYNSRLAPGTPAGVFDANGVYTASDRRLKQNVKPLSANALAQIMALKPVDYQYLNQTETIPGLIAQDLQKVLPSLVKSVPAHNGSEDYLTVNYGALSPIIIKAIQEQQLQIEELKKQNAFLLQLIGDKK
jgi:Chaperone of endosialidase